MVEKIAPLVIACTSLIVTAFFAFSDKSNKEQIITTTQLDAVSKVLPYISDTNSRKNLIGLMMLTNFGQDSLALRLIRTDFFDKNTISKASLYILKNSRDTSSLREARKLISPNERALENAILELNQNYVGHDIYEALEKYNGFCNLQECEEWAAPFVCWCFNKDERRFKVTGQVDELEQNFLRDGWTFTLSKISKPKPGDIYFYYSDWHHKRCIGIVESYDDNVGLSGIEPDQFSNGVSKNIIYRRVLDEDGILSQKTVFARVENSYKMNTGSFDCLTASIINCTTGEGIGSPCYGAQSVIGKEKDSLNILIYYHNNGLAKGNDLSFTLTDIRNRVVAKDGYTSTLGCVVVNNDTVAAGIVGLQIDGGPMVLKVKSITNYISYEGCDLQVAHGESIFSKKGLHIGEIQPGWRSQGIIRCAFILEKR